MSMVGMADSIKRPPSPLSQQPLSLSQLPEPKIGRRPPSTWFFTPRRQNKGIHEVNHYRQNKHLR